MDRWAKCILLKLTLKPYILLNPIYCNLGGFKLLLTCMHQSLAINSRCCVLDKLIPKQACYGLMRSRVDDCSPSHTLCLNIVFLVAKKERTYPIFFQG
jgi:hypothetical protein